MISSQDHIGRAAGVKGSQSREFPVGHWAGASLIEELGEEGHGPRASCVGASQVMLMGWLVVDGCNTRVSCICYQARAVQTGQLGIEGVWAM